MTSGPPDARIARGRRRNTLLLGILFTVIAVANAVRAIVDDGAGGSWVVAGLFALGAVCFLVAARPGRADRPSA